MLWHSKAQEVLIGMYGYVPEIFQALQMRQLIFDIHQREYDQYLVKVFFVIVHLFISFCCEIQYVCSIY